MISDGPPGPASDPDSLAEVDGGSSVPGCCLQYGTDLTVYRAVIEDPELMSDKLGREVHTGAPRKVASQQIVILEEEEYCRCCLGSYSEDVLCS